MMQSGSRDIAIQWLKRHRCNCTAQPYKVFAPDKSIVRKQFEKCIPPWILSWPKMEVHWNAALQTLEGHTYSVSSVAFSPDGKQVVSRSRDRTVRL